MNKTKSVTIQNMLKGLKKGGETLRLALILVVVCICMAVIDASTFYTGPNFLNMAEQFPEYSLMALGIMLAMIAGGIDLSVVGIANLCAVLVGKTMVKFVAEDAAAGTFVLVFIACIIMGLAVGALCGLFNGFLVSKFGIPPMLVTMGSMQLFQGICMVLTEGTAVTGIPAQYPATISYRIGGFLPLSVILFALCAFITWVFLEKMPFGTRLYMMGTNAHATKMAGIKNDQVTRRVFILSGIFAAIAGFIMLARMNSARADFGESYTTQALLIVILAGTNPSGGYAKVSSMLLAIVIMQFVSSGMSMIPSVSSYIKTLTWGVILVVMIIINWYAAKAKNRRLTS
ncbi:MAG: ABC transporter permease [Christensenellaceae bacterium]|nr:ABC transporter permease [Christensenellaceae bacterium]